MRPRSANEWRDFWRDGGERELHAQLEELAPYSGSHLDAARQRAPLRALVAEFGRIRENELKAVRDHARDAELAERIYAWFEGFRGTLTYSDGSARNEPFPSTLVP